MSPRELRDLCDPAQHSREESRQIARTAATHDRAFHLQVLANLREQTLAARPNLGAIGRTLDVLDATTPGCTFSSLLKPILRDCDPLIQSKCVLMAARRETNLGWIEKLLDHEDARVRASAVEGLWDNKTTGVPELFKRAARDFNHRVVANAAYGLRRAGAEEFEAVIRRMEQNADPLFRRAAAWVIRKIGAAELRSLLKPLVLDPEPAVRQAAFKSLAALGARES